MVVLVVLPLSVVMLLLPAKAEEGINPAIGDKLKGICASSHNANIQRERPRRTAALLSVFPINGREKTVILRKLCAYFIIALIKNHLTKEHALWRGGADSSNPTP